MARTNSYFALQAKYEHSPSASFADFLEVHQSVDSLSSRFGVMYVSHSVIPSTFLPKFKKQAIALHENCLCTTKRCPLIPVNDFEEVVLTTAVCAGKAFYAS